MHELGLAQAIGEIALEAVRDRSREVPRRVGRIWVRVGDLSGVDPDALGFCFEVVRGEWVELAEAALAIERCPARVRCRECGTEAELAGLEAGPVGSMVEACPCGSADREVVGGRELDVVRLELQEAAA
jgi:hydrogenase nickel incorporation protein HypA/HybF